MVCALSYVRNGNYIINSRVKMCENARIDFQRAREGFGRVGGGGGGGGEMYGNARETSGEVTKEWIIHFICHG
jgi:hypothetical protein